MSQAVNHKRNRRLGFGIGLVAAGLALGLCLFTGGNTVNTENAYIKADKLSLAPEINANITEVLVRANQPVHKGDLLVTLDATNYQLAVNEAEAHLAQVHNQLQAKRADYAEAQAALEQARQDADFYQRQLHRNEQLTRQALPEAKLDESRQQLTKARAQIEINIEKLASLRAELGGDPATPLSAQADLQVAQAQLDRARYQLSRTRIVAPTDGVIANDVPQVGEMAAAGIPLLSLLDTHHIWVEANLKETELEQVRTGQWADVKVDAYPGQVWRARVDSLSAASGAEFALIPPQNASGNWVKVVQRVPVRLQLQAPTQGSQLRAGMSAEVAIAIEQTNNGHSSASVAALTQASDQTQVWQ